ncbi:spore germination protein [Bacillus sp. AFS088145]|uniref:spore germination protein n=1 Tax=Bacillus sp. AFS088145 TaxID=2033514 RepID=UPI000BF9A14A|nr:spore germination protein [Bacillus sp. AFS088145]PFH87808.1 hypothetical protein COI44_09425 [Bacillus sp. AFS088145]
MNNVHADITNSFHKNIEIIKEQLHHTAELIVRTIRIGETESFDVALLYLDDLVNADVIRDFIITPLFLFQNIKKNDSGPFIDNLASRHIRASSVEIVSYF